MYRQRLDVVRLDAARHRVPSCGFRPGDEHTVQSNLRAACGSVRDKHSQRGGVYDGTKRNLSGSCTENVVETNQALLSGPATVFDLDGIFVTARCGWRIFFEVRVLRAAVAAYSLAKSIYSSQRIVRQQKTEANR